MNITKEQVDAAVLNITSGPDWEVVKQALAHEVYQVQAGALDLDTWAKVCEARGYAKGLVYVMGLREMTINAQAQEAINANV